MLSIYPIPKSVIRKVDIYRRRLLWQGGHHLKKFHLVDWTSVCSPKNQEGFMTKKSLQVNILRKIPLFLSNKNKETLIFGRRF
jgi:hypothetical protein